MSRYYVHASVAIAACLTASSHAVTIFDQLGTGGTPETGQAGWASQNFETANDAFDGMVVDDFITTQSWKLSNVSMGVIFFNVGAPSTSLVTGYTVNVYNWNSGVPVTSLTGDVASFSLGAAAATWGAAGFAGNSLGYQLTLDLTAQNFTLGAGHYWVGVNLTNDFSANGQTGILGSTIADANSVATNARMINPGGGFGLAGNNASIGTINNGTEVNLSYQINANPVPEPASMAVLGIGALALLRRRMKKA